MVVFTKEPRVEEALRRANKYGANKYGGNGVGKQLVELLLEERSFSVFVYSPTHTPFPHMSHPVSPICQKLILFFRF